VISWPTGIETIKHLLATDDLQKVTPSLNAASAFLDAAAKHSQRPAGRRRRSRRRLHAPL
jgi:hypothetical protein